jgi:hypothetical protein
LLFSAILLFLDLGFAVFDNNLLSVNFQFILRLGCVFLNLKLCDPLLKDVYLLEEVLVVSICMLEFVDLCLEMDDEEVLLLAAEL